MTEPNLIWRADYTDGSSLSQKAPDGTKFGYQDIDRDRLTAFSLWLNPDTNEGNTRSMIWIDFRADTNNPDVGQKRLIWRRRTVQNGKGVVAIVHLVGWQRTVNGLNTQAIVYINEETLVPMLGGQFTEGLQFHGPIVPLECERDLV